MQYKPSPPKLPPRPSMIVSIYKTLPDASNADLPPKPPVTPNSLSPSRFQFPQAALTSSPNKTTHYRKRKYSPPTDSIVVPLQYDETAERSAKFHRTTLNRTTVNNHKDTNNYITSNKRAPSSSKTMNRQPQDITGPKTPRIKLQLIHDTLLGGAKSITTRDQEFLAEQLHNSPACVSALMVWLVAEQVTKKTYNLSHGILHWARDNSEIELVEYILKDILYAFDVEEAFEQGLMGIMEVTDLIEHQILLHVEREKRLEKPQKKLAEHSATSASFDADLCESDIGSTDMDLSEEDC
ncbi:hypothetical protein FHL15_007362 [Xylaria flabelliformis]|uniref:Uncharacterized protein n=1 Tax=Xylaria flabelliformis TaxID=2512241 RepID=A0A553HV34_9PEZI|nr:hypothetical protein FHL15_007362 [Xylaria flabelliformis]